MSIKDEVFDTSLKGIEQTISMMVDGFDERIAKGGDDGRLAAALKDVMPGFTRLMARERNFIVDNRSDDKVIDTHMIVMECLVTGMLATIITSAIPCRDFEGGGVCPNCASNRGGVALTMINAIFKSLIESITGTGGVVEKRHYVETAPEKQRKCTH